MKPVNKIYFKKYFGCIFLYALLGLMPGGLLVGGLNFLLIFLVPLIPYLIAVVFARFSVDVYLIMVNYLILIMLACPLSAIWFTMLLASNADHYYGLTLPWSVIVAIVCTGPSILLMAYLLIKGSRPLDTIASSYTNRYKKINIEKHEYYMNQGINVLKDIAKLQLEDLRLEKFLKKHVTATFRVITILCAVGPIIPVMVMRTSGQQPVNFIVLMIATYFTFILAIAFAIGIHMTRTVFYIQKKHNIKLKLAYKDDKDVIIV